MDIESFDAWADVYDVLHQHEESDDVPFYVEQAKQADGPVLEIGCGTGRVYLELLKAGVDAYGIDVSENMLDILREKAAEEGLEPKVFQDDMRGFDLEQEFALIIIPFRTFLHNLTLRDQLRTLNAIKNHLQPDGELILNFFAPNAEYIAEQYGAEERTEIEADDGVYTLVEQPEMTDRIENRVALNKRVEDEHGEVVWESDFEIALLQKREFELLLRLAGFSDWELYGGFNQRPFQSIEQEMVWRIKA